MLVLDHIAVSAGRLAEGADVTERALGVPLQPGGEHPHFGTHNRLLGLGAEYLEVIAVDPAAPSLPHKRWFHLDAFSGPPRLTNWIVRTASLEAALETLGPGYGQPVALSRGDLCWRMAVPESGLLPHDNCAPAVIEWETEPPAARLTQRDCTLSSLTIRHPKASALAEALAPLIDDARLSFETGMPGLTARIATPAGERVLA
ncbi:MAG: VOC family protein [Pseudomonadota bacterium]